MKTLHCSDIGFNCPAVIHATSDEEVLKQAAVHAREVHGITVTPELVQQIMPLIKNEANNTSQ